MPKEEAMIFRQEETAKDKLQLEIENTLRKMKSAENMLNYSQEPELVESAILEMESARKRYNYLLKKMKNS